MGLIAGEVQAIFYDLANSNITFETKSGLMGDKSLTIGMSPGLKGAIEEYVAGKGDMVMIDLLRREVVIDDNGATTVTAIDHSNKAALQSYIDKTQDELRVYKKNMLAGMVGRGR